MVAQGKMDKGKVYIVREGYEAIDSVWDHAEDAARRAEQVRKAGYIADILVRKVR
jgi:uncharacterized protein Yka (UPF0111/DUF47 family)